MPTATQITLGAVSRARKECDRLLHLELKAHTLPCGDQDALAEARVAARAELTDALEAHGWACIRAGNREAGRNFHAQAAELR